MDEDTGDVRGGRDERARGGTRFDRGGRAGEDDEERDGRVSSPSEVVAHEIRVLGEVDGLERESAEALAAIDRLVLRSGGTTGGRGERAGRARATGGREKARGRVT